LFFLPCPTGATVGVVGTVVAVGTVVVVGVGNGGVGRGMSGIAGRVGRLGRVDGAAGCVCAFVRVGVGRLGFGAECCGLAVLVVVRTLGLAFGVGRLRFELDVDGTVGTDATVGAEAAVLVACLPFAGLSGFEAFGPLPGFEPFGPLPGFGSGRVGFDGWGLPGFGPGDSAGCRVVAPANFFFRSLTSSIAAAGEIGE
jgi:hypothetical protein